MASNQTGSPSPSSASACSPCSHRHHDAAKKRQELLDRRRERMAARVQHAKLVAERHRHEGHTASRERFGKLETQLKAAESNRQVLLQRAKEHHGAQVTHAKMVAQRHRSLREETHAAMTIQDWWRLNTLLLPAIDIIAPYLAAPSSAAAPAATTITPVSVPAMEAAGFESASETVQSAAVTGAFSALFEALRRSSPVAASCIRGKRPERAFLGAHIIAAFPDITDSGDDVDKSGSLRDAAHAMIASFSQWVAKAAASHHHHHHPHSLPASLPPTPGPALAPAAPHHHQQQQRSSTASSLLEKFLANFYLFCDRFEEWRTPDSKKLLSRLVLHFDDLEVLDSGTISLSPPLSILTPLFVFLCRCSASRSGATTGSGTSMSPRSRVRRKGW